MSIREGEISSDFILKLAFHHFFAQGEAGLKRSFQAMGSLSNLAKLKRRHWLGDSHQLIFLMRW